jgi:hypothetical protein
VLVNAHFSPASRESFLMWRSLLLELASALQEQYSRRYSPVASLAFPRNRILQTVIGGRFLYQAPRNDRRFTSRVEVPEKIWLYWSCNGRDDVSRLHDLSIGGLFIQTREPKAVGATAKLAFLVAEGQIRAEAILRHVRPKVGLGLQFTALCKEDRAHLAALLARLRGRPRVRPDSSDPQLTKTNSLVLDLTDELRLEM